MTELLSIPMKYMSKGRTAVFDLNWYLEHLRRGGRKIPEEEMIPLLDQVCALHAETGKLIERLEGLRK
jgi:hypothetical protein